MTLGSDFDMSSEGLVEKAKGEGLYQPDSGPFDFAAVFSVPQGGEEGDQADRRDKGKQLMEKLTAKSNYYYMLHIAIHDEILLHSISSD